MVFQLLWIGSSGTVGS